MVTEIPGKGRGLVAARDIEKGQLIFIDKPVIKLAMNVKGKFEPDFMASLNQQIESLPTEARAQYYKLTTRDEADGNIYNLSRRDWEALKLFHSNSKIYRDEFVVLHLNIALVNHSCAPNATYSNKEDQEELSVELRANKSINKGEEITICYFSGLRRVLKLGGVPRKRKAAIKKDCGFDCNCPVCLGQVPDQEKTLKKLIELHSKLNPTPSDWKREAGLCSRIVDLTMELYIGDPLEKFWASHELLRFAHLARDKDLVKKATAMAKQVVGELKLERIQREYENLEMGLASWSKEFSSSNAPEKREIDFFHRIPAGHLQ